MNSATTQGVPTAEDDAVTILSDLIRFDTTNPGRPERPAAEHVAMLLADVGIDVEVLEGEPGRTNVIARVEGDDPTRAPLLLHGHLDVVPADPAEWTVHPFSGEVCDGCVWGRGAVDMKDFVAMVLAVVRAWRRAGRRPQRDLVLAFMADEETGSTAGARWLGAQHPQVFAGCEAAISEVGGFSVSLNDRARLYLVQTSEKGLAWLRLRATGTQGHASMTHPDNAVTELAQAVARIGTYEFPVRLRPEVRVLLEQLEPVVGRSLDPGAAAEWLPALGGLARVVGASLRNSANPTRLAAGSKDNVVPSSAEATVDARFLPGDEDELMTQLRALAGDRVAIEVTVRGDAVEAPFEGALVEGMCAALHAEDPGAIPIPYLFTGGTDAKVFGPMGLRCYGFAPLRLPSELDFTAMFHGVDERVPVESLRFGVRVLDRLLTTA